MSPLGESANDQKDYAGPEYPSDSETNEGREQMNWSTFAPMSVRWAGKTSLWRNKAHAQRYGPEKHLHDYV
jgi:hypothetical protein